MTNFEFVDALPVSTITLNPPKEKKYLTPEALDALEKNPHRLMLLGGGEWVDKGYVPKLEEQAAKRSPEIQIHFRLLDTGYTMTKKNKRSYFYKGTVYACWGEAKVKPVEAPKVAEPKKKKKKKNKKKES